LDCSPQVVLNYGISKGPQYAPTSGVSLSCDLSKLFECSISPRTTKLLQQLQGAVVSWNESLPETSTALANAIAIQQAQSQTAQFLWGVSSPVGRPLVEFVKPDPPLLWHTVYRVNNSFLEALQLAGRLLVRGLAALQSSKEEAEAAAALKDAALVQSSVSAWLASYGVGLGAPALLPQFDLGTTPLA
jgi:hypothetical protein